jgi:protocatechuate 3,4-dioxygenase beta subunit
MKFHHLLFAYLLLVLVNGPDSFAQIAANLRGRVLDPSGAAVPSAHVDLTESAKNVHQSTTTSSTGDYLFPNLNPGSYAVAVTAPGFEEAEPHRHHRHRGADREC